MEKVKKPFYKKWWFWVIAVFVVIVVATNQGGDTTVTTSAEPSASSATTSSVEVAPSTATVTVAKVSETKVEPVEEKAIVVSAEALAKQFEENEIKGNQLYKDKMVEVKGKIDDIGEILGSTFIVLSSGKEFSITNVQCSFSDKAEIAKIIDLKKGDIVTVIGKVDGKSMNVSVEKCKFK